MNSDELQARPWRLPRVGLYTALGLAISVALAIVAVAYFLYWRSPNRKYDIERGDSSHTNQALSVDDEDADTTNPVDAPAAKRKSDYLQKEIGALNGLNKFDPEDLNDQNLQLSPVQQPSL